MPLAAFHRSRGGLHGQDSDVYVALALVCFPGRSQEATFLFSWLPPRRLFGYRRGLAGGSPWAAHRQPVWVVAGGCLGRPWNTCTLRSTRQATRGLLLTSPAPGFRRSEENRAPLEEQTSCSTPEPGRKV